MQCHGLVRSRHDALGKTRGLGRNAACGASNIFFFKTQPQRRIAGRTRLTPGLITIQPGCNLHPPGRSVLSHNFIAVVARSNLCRRRRAQRLRSGRFGPSRRRSGGIRFRRTAADVTTKRTRHESHLRKYRNSEPLDNHEDGPGIQDSGRLCVVCSLSARRTAPVPALPPEARPC